MSNVKNIRAVSEADEAWQAIIAAGGRELMERALALRPTSITILVEVSDEFKMISFPPGEAAGRWMIKTLAESELNKDGDSE